MKKVCCILLLIPLIISCLTFAVEAQEEDLDSRIFDEEILEKIQSYPAPEPEMVIKAYIISPLSLFKDDRSVREVLAEEDDAVYIAAAYVIKGKTRVDYWMPHENGDPELLKRYLPDGESPNALYEAYTNEILRMVFPDVEIYHMYYMSDSIQYFEENHYSTNRNTIYYETDIGDYVCILDGLYDPLLFKAETYREYIHFRNTYTRVMLENVPRSVSQQFVYYKPYNEQFDIDREMELPELTPEYFDSIRPPSVQMPESDPIPPYALPQKEPAEEPEKEPNWQFGWILVSGVVLLLASGVAGVIVYKKQKKAKA